MFRQHLPAVLVHMFMLHGFVKTEPHFLRTAAPPVTYYKWAKRSYQIKVTDPSGPILQAHTGHQMMQKPCSGSVHKCEQRATHPCPISQYLWPIIHSHKSNPSKPEGGLPSFSHFMISALPAFTAASSGSCYAHVGKLRHKGLWIKKWIKDLT